MGIMFLNTLCSLLWFLALEAVCKQVPSYDLVPLWQVVLKTFGSTVYEPWIHKLLLIQWAVWLSECHYEGILHLLLQVNQKVCIFYFFVKYVKITVLQHLSKTERHRHSNGKLRTAIITHHFVHTVYNI